MSCKRRNFVEYVPVNSDEQEPLQLHIAQKKSFNVITREKIMSWGDFRFCFLSTVSSLCCRFISESFSQVREEKKNMKQNIENSYDDCNRKTM